MADTLNYSEMTQAFMSFTSSKPVWYLDFKSKYYSFDSNKDLWKHNIDDGTSNRLSHSDIHDSSFIRFLVNETYQQTKVFDNISYTGDNMDSMNPSYVFYTTGQTSGIADPSIIIKREDTFSLAIPRDRSVTKFAPRMRGKYLTCDYTFINADGLSFTLPFIETTYRYSII